MLKYGGWSHWCNGKTPKKHPVHTPTTPVIKSSEIKTSEK